MSQNLNLPIPHLADLDRISQVTNAVIDLDFIVEELFKGGDVEDLVRGGLGGVDDELCGWVSVSHGISLKAVKGARGDEQARGQMENIG